MNKTCIVLDDQPISGLGGFLSKLILVSIIHKPPNLSSWTLQKIIFCSCKLVRGPGWQRLCHLQHITSKFTLGVTSASGSGERAVTARELCTDQAWKGTCHVSHPTGQNLVTRLWPSSGRAGMEFNSAPKRKGLFLK